MQHKQDKTDKTKKVLYGILIILSAISILDRILFRAYWVTESLFNGPPELPFQALYIHTYPQKRVYVAGIDMELDLTEGELCYYDIELHDPEVNAMCDKTQCELIVSMEQVVTDHEHSDVSVYTDADFSVPGEYTVIFRSRQTWSEEDAPLLSCSFPIVVIDPKDAVN